MRSGGHNGRVEFADTVVASNGYVCGFCDAVRRIDRCAGGCREKGCDGAGSADHHVRDGRSASGQSRVHCANK